MSDLRALVLGAGGQRSGVHESVPSRSRWVDAV